MVRSGGPQGQCAPIDAEVAAGLAELPFDMGVLFGGLTDDSLASVRAAMAEAPVLGLGTDVQRSDVVVPGHDGLHVRVHRPVGVQGTLPCLYWMHGGGLVLGGVTGDDVRFDRWCVRFGCVGVSVDYRLAPECPYPGPLDDCYDGLAWVHDNATELGVDRARLGVGGVSAGGGLAAGVALLARERGHVPLAFQLLIYPMLDDRQITVSSAWADPVWPPAANTYGWSAYLGERKGGDAVSPYAAAARAIDLSGLPPTYIAVGAIDGLSDEDIDYAVRLRHAGVPVDLRVYAGAPHGFDGLAPRATVSRRARRDVQEWLAGQLGID